MNLTHSFYRVYQSVYKVAMGALDWTPPELLQGAGAIKKLPALVKKQGVNNVLVVTDKGLMGLHLLDSLFEGLNSEGIKYTVFDGVQPNPTIYNVEDALKLYHDNGCEAFIAFGGGSPMDCAKVTAAKVARPNKSIPSMRGQLKVLKKTPLIFAVPTTAGTGSETTLAAVISNPDTHEKNAINDPVLRPKFAVLDPELTVGLPPHITSTTGMDALTHAVESYIGNSTTKQTRAAAEFAVKTILENLIEAYNNGNKLSAVLFPIARQAVTCKRSIARFNTLCTL